MNTTDTLQTKLRLTILEEPKAIPASKYTRININHKWVPILFLESNLVISFLPCNQTNQLDKKLSKRKIIHLGITGNEQNE